MRKNINKIIAFAIGVSVMSGSIIPVFAADSTTNASTTTTTASNAASTTTANSNVLTLDDAIKAAISINDTLALDEQKIAAQDKINTLNKKQDDFNDVKDYQEKYDDDKADATLNQAKQQRDFDEDSLTQNVTDKYNNIVSQQMTIDMETKQLAVDQKNLNDAKLKQSLGIQTSIDIQTSELAIQKEQNTLTTNQNQLKDAEYTFKTLTGKDVTQYTLEKDIKFEPFKIDGSIDDYLDNVIETDLNYSEQLLKISQDYYNDKDYKEDKNVEDGSNGTSDDLSNLEADAEQAETDKATYTSKMASDTDFSQYQQDQKSFNNANTTINNYTNALQARIAYAQAKLSNNQSDTNITTGKKKLKDQLKSYYTNLQTYENNIDYYKKQIELNNEQLSNYKLKYDLGMMTEVDYNAQVVATLQAEINLRSAVIAYNQYKEYLQKPWIAASSNATLY